jgi:hypothetical protein
LGEKEQSGMKTRGYVFLFLLLFAALLPAPSGFAAERTLRRERILNYESTASVYEDASMAVRERVTFNVTGLFIKHGITRIFPVDYKTDAGKKYSTGFKLLSVKLDGEPIQSEVSRSGANVEIKIGESDKTIPTGEHTFEILYKVTGHVRDLTDRDAIYWNVTGNDWEFPIDKASFQFLPPTGAKFIADNAYTGLRGESGSDFRRSEKSLYLYETTRPLAMHEGFTVAVDWEKGVVTFPPPPPRSAWEIFTEDYRWVVLLGLPILMLLYYAIAWCIVGRDPRMRAIVPIFYPPEGMTPGYMAALRNMKAVPTCFSADVIELAVRGWLRIESKGKKELSFYRADGAVPKKPLSESLENFMDALLPSGRDAVKSNETSLLSKAWERLKLTCNINGEKLYKYNYGASSMGVVLMFVALAFWILMCLIWGYPEDETEHPLIVLGALCIGLPVSWLGLSALKAVWTRPVNFLVCIFISIVPCVLCVVGLVSLTAAVIGDLYLSGSVCLSLAVAAYCSFWLMPKRTEEGVRQLEQVEGLAMYIGTAERGRLAVLNAPEDSPEIFERLLAYAVALDCADAWNKRFGSILANLDYKPDWFDGNLSDLFRTSNAINASAYSASRYSLNNGLVDFTSNLFSRGSGTSGGSSGGGSGGGGGRGW